MRAFWFLILVSCSTQPSRGQSLADAFDQVHSSVVTIRVTEFEMALRSPGQVVTTRGVGSGVLISSDGKILTAAHVGQTADRLARVGDRVFVMSSGWRSRSYNPRSGDPGGR